MAKIKFKKTTLKSYDSLFQIVSNNKISTSRDSERLFSFIDSDTIQIRKGSKPEENLMVAGRLIYNLPLTSVNKRKANREIYNKFTRPIRNSYGIAISNGFDASTAEKNASVRLTESLYSVINDTYNAIEYARSAKISALHYSNDAIIDSANELISKSLYFLDNSYAYTDSLKAQELISKYIRALNGDKSVVCFGVNQITREEMYDLSSMFNCRMKELFYLLKPYIRGLEDEPTHYTDSNGYEQRSDGGKAEGLNEEKSSSDSEKVTKEKQAFRESKKIYKQVAEKADEYFEQMQGVYSEQIENSQDVQNQEVNSVKASIIDTDIDANDLSTIEAIQSNVNKYLRRYPINQFGRSLDEGIKLNIPSDNGGSIYSNSGLPSSDLWKINLGYNKVFESLLDPTDAPRICVLVDCSGSTMFTNKAVNGIRVNLQEKMWELAGELMRMSPESRCYGFDGYSTELNLYEGFTSQIANQNKYPRKEGGGGTPTSEALMYAKEHEQTESDLIILVTDGAPDTNFYAVQKWLINLGIKLAVIVCDGGTSKSPVQWNAVNYVQSGRMEFAACYFPFAKDTNIDSVNSVLQAIDL